MNRRFLNMGLNLSRLFKNPATRKFALCVGVGAFVIATPHLVHESVTTHCENVNRSNTINFVSPRIKLKNELLRTLRPLGSFKSFPVVYGVDGSGKSTILQNIITDLEGDAFYCNIPVNAKDLEAQLCSTFGDLDSCVEDCIRKSSLKFFETNHRPMILVLDSVENLARASPASVQKFLRLAKECVESGTVKIVFVCNDSAVNFLQSDALWAYVDPIEVPELSELESIQYLSARGVQPVVAKEAVLSLTGGNLYMLQRFVVCHVDKKEKLEAVRASWFNEVCASLEQQQDQGMTNYQLGLRLLTDKKSISVREALDYFSKGDLKRLVDQGVLSYHSGAKFLRLRNKLVEKYFSDKFGKT